jgi:hypothetical protein
MCYAVNVLARLAIAHQSCEYSRLLEHTSQVNKFQVESPMSIGSSEFTPTLQLQLQKQEHEAHGI